jgi:hypothetical protein
MFALFEEVITIAYYTEIERKFWFDRAFIRKAFRTKKSFTIPPKIILKQSELLDFMSSLKICFELFAKNCKANRVLFFGGR